MCSRKHKHDTDFQHGVNNDTLNPVRIPPFSLTCIIHITIGEGEKIIKKIKMKEKTICLHFLWEMRTTVRDVVEQVLQNRHR